MMKFLNNKKSLILASALGLTSLLSAPAFAGGGIGLGILGAGSATLPFYVGGSAGSSDLSPQLENCCGSVKSADSDGSDLSLKLLAGYNINRRLAVEGFYNDLGSTAVSLAGEKLGDVDYKTYGVAAVYTKPVSRRISLRAKLGYGALDSNFEGDVQHKEENGSFLYKAVGAEYQITKRLSLLADYDHFDKDVQALSAGLKFGF